MDMSAGGLSSLLIDAGRPSPLWAASFPGKVAPGWMRKHHTLHGCCWTSLVVSSLLELMLCGTDKRPAFGFLPQLLSVADCDPEE